MATAGYHARMAGNVVALEEARRYGAELDINPFVALLQEVRRSAGHVAWLGAKVAEAPTDNDLLEEWAPWIRLYQKERGNLTKACEMAIKAGLETRLVQIEEAKAELIARVLLATLESLDLPPDIRARAPQVLREQLLMLDAVPVAV